MIPYILQDKSWFILSKICLYYAHCPAFQPALSMNEIEIAFSYCFKPSFSKYGSDLNTFEYISQEFRIKDLLLNVFFVMCVARD